ncbi:glucosamine-6-phosphate deaminase [Sedimentibacter acidaminivorans]|jgi:glucosamine-6-phosphate deaminase|uniref:Glucosamine-6-phosphate deaminase n=1 Tax=Sedimentibacter acidaminivorans TaxID=913099 RepID=A0ABS4GAY0_9FIRM|nr:glucosamine-6-phosphate deaminase [Sedimentibacter acidaminivorans]MBP1924848.1 glucosamine-6-phosphate deaminase [Sedimentibacter acidaminivorans]
MEIVIKKDYDEVSELAAKYMLDVIRNKENAVLGLPTGGTPIRMYNIVVEEYKRKKILFNNIKTFNLDEYIGLSKLNKQSYYYFMNKHLFSYTDIKEENIHTPNGMTKDVLNECINYENKIKAVGSMDILFLGIGQNGHIGFNEPADFFEPYTHKVILKEKTVKSNSRFFEKIEDVPVTAITMGVKTILSAKKIVMLAIGETKADAISKMVNGKITPQLPASILQLHNDVTVIVDENASKYL